MGFLDRAKKLAEQAKDMAEGALSEAKSRIPSSSSAPPAGGSAPAGDPAFGTPYVPGMLGRRGWREAGVTDPAGVLPIRDRDAAGIPHSTHSTIVAEPYGVGRRWTAGPRSAGLFHQLDPDQQGWEPPLGRTPYAGASGAWATSTPEGRHLVFLAGHVVVEMSGLDDAAQAALVRAAADHLD